MSIHKKALLRDLSPRGLGIALLCLIGWLVSNHLSQTDLDIWSEKITKANATAVSSLSNTLKKNTSLIGKLAQDRRLLSLFEGEFKTEETTPQSARRAIYEFKYIHKVDHIYIFDAGYSEIVLKSAASPNLPNSALMPFYKAAEQNLEQLTNIVFVNGQAYILAARAIYNDMSTITGYAIYIEPTHQFFKQISGNLTQYSYINFNAYMVSSQEDTVFAVDDFTRVPTALRMLSQQNIILPIFKENIDPKQLTLANNQNVLAITASYIDIPKWKIATYVSMWHILSLSKHKYIFLVLTVLLGSIVLILTPLKGPYSNILRRFYHKMGMVKELKIHLIGEDDIQRMRLSAPPLNAPNLEEMQKNKQSNKENKLKHKDNYRPNDTVIAYNIRTGIKNRRMKLLYQPIFNTQTNQISMYEVYLRIIDDEGETMPPALWLPVAKKENLFSLIDETVVQIAAEKCFIGEKPLNTALAFNISGDTFDSLEFLQKLMASSSDDYSIAKHTIFEIHSREIIEDKRAMRFIKKCREMGFRFSIDYFGGGPQTLKAAKTLKFDFVKLDILQFNLKTEQGQKEFIKLVKTAESIKLPIVIEKIEDEKMLRLCKKLGANFVQGYYLGKPLPYLIEDV